LVCSETEHGDCHCDGFDPHCAHAEDEALCSCLPGNPPILSCTDGPIESTPPSDAAVISKRFTIVTLFAAFVILM
jgi:hypothetical protein